MEPGVPADPHAPREDDPRALLPQQDRVTQLGHVAGQECLERIRDIRVKKEMKRSGDSKILHEIFRDTKRKSEKHELIYTVSQNISYM